jgi:hypothetical protein
MNNRQAGRRRGRGGQQARNGQPGGSNNGSRLDNRARGNAAQLLEKYKTLARDAQMQGDRVNTEYYLQFADHYFRVLSENRARFEEQRSRQQGDDRDEFGDEEGGDIQARGNQGEDWDEGDDGDQPQQRAPQDSRNERRGEGRGDSRNDGRSDTRNDSRNGNGANGNGYERGGEGRRDRRSAANGNSQLRDAQPRETASQAPDEDGGFAPDFISQRIEAQPANPQLEQDVAEATDAVTEEAPRRTRRPRRPRTEAVVEA